MSPRLNTDFMNSLSPRQKEIRDDIVSRRGGLGGPFQVWLRNPELAERAQMLGAYCRYDTCLPPMLSELAILTVARHWSAEVEWAIHAPIAQRVGLPEATIAEIRAGDDPDLAEAGAQVVYDYTKHLLETGRVDDDLHSRAIAELGESGAVDLVALIGYYTLVALTLNAFEVPIPHKHAAKNDGDPRDPVGT